MLLLLLEEAWWGCFWESWKKPKAETTLAQPLLRCYVRNSKQTQGEKFLLPSACFRFPFRHPNGQNLVESQLVKEKSSLWKPSPVWWKQNTEEWDLDLKDNSLITFTELILLLLKQTSWREALSRNLLSLPWPNRVLVNISWAFWVILWQYNPFWTSDLIIHEHSTPLRCFMYLARKCFSVQAGSFCKVLSGSRDSSFG